jgi:monofunctional biosynthetic peptidoglycan transglycosylase
MVASEDQKFLSHHGFDVDSIQDALATNDERPRGASTISQQTAKNLFLWSGRSFVRKGVEAWLTVYLELLWPKKRILEVYVNVAELGPGIYGLEAASRRYFRKPAAQLLPHEAALLAACCRIRSACPPESLLPTCARARAGSSGRCARSADRPTSRGCDAQPGGA